jgi:hypothetical protein
VSRNEYLRLDPPHIVDTAEALERRIAERFPDRNLRRVVGALVAAARTAGPRTARLARPIVGLRLAIAAVLLAAPALIVWLIGEEQIDPVIRTLPELVQTAEAALASLVFVGAAVFFLLSLETRIKRQRTVRALDELRALAHVVDMHQLTKDPERAGQAGGDTPSSPERDLTPWELGRYLDYCAECMALISKVAALYAQVSSDSLVGDAVDDIEDLTNGLARKIWQKIMLLHNLYAPGQFTPPDTPVRSEPAAAP